MNFSAVKQIYLCRKAVCYRLPVYHHLLLSTPSLFTLFTNPFQYYNSSSPPPPFSSLLQSVIESPTDPRSDKLLIIPESENPHFAIYVIITRNLLCTSLHASGIFFFFFFAVIDTIGTVH